MPGLRDVACQGLDLCCVAGVQAIAVLQQERAGRRDPGALIAVREGMVVDQGIHQDGGFGEGVRRQVFAVVAAIRRMW